MGLYSLALLEKGHLTSAWAITILEFIYMFLAYTMGRTILLAVLQVAQVFGELVSDLHVMSHHKWQRHPLAEVDRALGEDCDLIYVNSNRLKQGWTYKFVRFLE